MSTLAAQQILFNWLAIALVVVGGAVFLWAMFSDRSRGRKRCPRCWYDMSAAVSLVCPECGTDARKPRRLLRTRRRWKWAVFTLALWLGAYATWVALRIQREGVMGLVPTTALILAEPWNETRVSGNELVDVQEKAALTDGRARLRVRARLYMALDARIEGGELARWQRDWILRLCTRPATSPSVTRVFVNADLVNLVFWNRPEFEGELSGAALPPPIDVITRRRWPMNEPILAEVDIPWWQTSFPRGTKWTLLAGDGQHAVWRHISNFDSQPAPWGAGKYREWRQKLTPLADRLTVSQNIHLHAHIDPATNDKVPRAALDWTIDVPIEIAPDLESVVKPVDVPEITAALGKTAALTSPYSRGVKLTLDDLEHPLFIHPDMSFAVTVEVLHQGTLVARGHAWWSNHFPGVFLTGDLDAMFPSCRMPMSEEATVVHTDPVHLPIDPGPWGGEGWTVRLTGDPYVALLDFQAKEYWRGSVEIPLAPAPKLGEGK